MSVNAAVWAALYLVPESSLVWFLHYETWSVVGGQALGVFETAPLIKTQIVCVGESR